MKKSEIIKTASVPIFDLNKVKSKILAAFISDYKLAVIQYINFLWNNKISYTIEGQVKTFDIKNNQLNIPTMLSTVDIPIETNLSARALKCAITQALGIINSHIFKYKRLQFIKSKLQEQGKRTRYINRKIEKHPLTFPNLENILPERGKKAPML